MREGNYLDMSVGLPLKTLPSLQPTPNKRPNDPVAPMILEQLRYSGVFEVPFSFLVYSFVCCLC
jgi:hypothetical protein